MLRILIGELQKVFFRRSFMLILASLMLLNGFLLYQKETAGDVKPAAVRALYGALAKMSASQQKSYLENGEHDARIMTDIYLSDKTGTPLTALTQDEQEDLPRLLLQYREGTYLRYTGSVFAEPAFYEAALDEYNRVANHEKSLRQIISDAQSELEVSIFANPGTFSYRNIGKTGRDMQSLLAQKPVLDLSNGVNMATDSVGSDLIEFLLILFLCMRVFLTEKEKGQLTLIMPTRKGRAPLAAAKLLCVLVSCLLTGAAVYGVNLLMAARLYGFGNLLRPVQSVAGYDLCFLKMDVLRYLLVFFLTKLLALLAAALLVSLFCLLAKSFATVYLCAIAVFGTQYALFAAITPESRFGFFKYINLIVLFFVKPLYQSYYNLDLFGYPVNVIPAFLVFAAILLCLLCFLCIHFFCVQKSRGSGALRIFSHIRLPAPHGGVHLPAHELYKLMVTNKALLILVLLAGVQIFSFMRASSFQSTDDLYYKSYMQRLAGPVTPQKVAFIESERGRFDSVNRALSQLAAEYDGGKMDQNTYMLRSMGYQNALWAQNAFERVETRYRYIVNTQKETGQTLLFVYDTGFNALLGLDSDTGKLTNGLKMLLALIGCCAMLFSMEEACGAVRLIRTCRKGRGKTARTKIILCFALTIPVFLLCELPDFLHITANFGLPALSAPAASLPAFSFMRGGTLLTCVILFYLLRLLAALTAVLLILLLSCLTRSAPAAVLLSAGILAGPLILHLLGVRTADNISLEALFAGTPLLSGSAAGALAQTAAAVLTGALSFAVTLLRYERPHKFFARGSPHPAKI